jgi:hypothetical protein
MSKNIIKSDGSCESYDEEKVISSFIKSGASPELAAELTKELTRRIKNNMTTDRIYNWNLNQLKKIEPKAAIRYSLKKAIMDMGPDGFVFEQYIAKILREYGYIAEVGQIIKGYCVEHEVDVVAKKENIVYLIECKYHNSPGTKSDIKTTLYLNSRFLDIEKAHLKSNEFPGSNFKAWLITNTKCTSDAIKYACCVGLKVMAWHYPEDFHLQYFIESKKLYPVNILPVITEKQKERLFDSNIILVKDLLNFEVDSLARLLSINHNKVEKILNVVKLIYGNNTEK